MSVDLIAGLFLIGLGFLAKRFPGLIAGYNTMSAERKRRVDIEGLSSLVRNVLIALGLTLMVCGGIERLGMTQTADALRTISPALWIIFLFIRSRKYERKK